eukprot:4120994-Alexandrium_andersonii.AAC.1
MSNRDRGMRVTAPGRHPRRGRRSGATARPRRGGVPRRTVMPAPFGVNGELLGEVRLRGAPAAPRGEVREELRGPRRGRPRDRLWRRG